MSVRSGFGRVVRPRNMDNNWNYSDGTTTTSPSQSAAAVRAELGLGYDFSGLDSTIRPTLDRAGGQVRPVQPVQPVQPVRPTSSAATAPRYTGTPSPWLSPNAPRTVPNVVAPVTAPPVFDSSAYAGAASMFAPSGAVGVTPPPATGSSDVPTGYGGNFTGTRGMTPEQIADAALRQAVLAEQGQETDMVFADWLAGNLLETIIPDETPTVPVGDGGGGSSTTAADLAALQQFINDSIASVQGTYGGYRTDAQSAYEKALERVNAANAAASAAMSSTAPMAQFNYRFQPTVQPMAGGMDYLRAIGAPTTQVDATRQLGQQLMAGQMQSAQDFANASAAAAEQERLARVAAVQSAGLQGISGLESTAAALQAQIAAAQAAEERALQQSLLENRLKYGVV